MLVFRNREFMRELYVDLALIIVLTVIGYFADRKIAVAVLGCGLVCAGVHLYFVWKRYRAIAALAGDIDRILHGQAEVRIDENSEGELSILNSELQKMTLRLKEQAAMLQEDKLRLGNAIEDIFHQLRTPLTAMNLETSLLVDEDISYERRVQLVREQKKQLERMRWLVETLLKISKIDAGTALFVREQVAVGTLLQKAAEPLAIPMELREQTLQVQLDSGEESFTGDLRWTTEALGNILKNCMEHTPQGGTITITAGENPLFTEIIIQDNGSGFAKDELPYLFERFFKGKNAQNDSIGIGLALSRMIITAQNGTITAENAREGGARFIIRLYKSIV